MKLVQKVAAGAAIAMFASIGAASTASAQAPLELDLTALDELIIELQDVIGNLGENLGNVTENLGQQPGLNGALTAVGQLLTGDPIIDLIQEIVGAFS